MQRSIALIILTIAISGCNNCKNPTIKKCEQMICTPIIINKITTTNCICTKYKIIKNPCYKNNSNERKKNENLQRKRQQNRI